MINAVAIVITLLAALANASQNLFIRVGTDEGRVHYAVFVVMAMNLLILVPLVSVFYFPDYGLTRASWLSFAGAGIVGTLFGRLLKYTSIDKIGASRTEPITSSWALFATLLGVLLLGESLTAMHGLGIVLVVAGVTVIAWETTRENPDNLSRDELLVSVLIPFGAAFAYGWEPIFASFGLTQGTPAPVGLMVKTVAALSGFTLYLWWNGMLPDRNLLRSPDMRWLVAAGIANTIFLIGYYSALMLAPVNVVVPIIITSTLFVVVLSALFMPERLESVTRVLGLAAFVVVTGVMLITVYG